VKLVIYWLNQARLYVYEALMTEKGHRSRHRTDAMHRMQHSGHGRWDHEADPHYPLPNSRTGRS
jgi:hypothetical protein